MSIKHALLVLMLDEPTSASQLQTKFEETMGIWQLNIGQVTQTIQRLQRDGLAETAGTTISSNGRTVDTFQPTDLGREFVTEWFESPVTVTLSERDELVTKIAIAESRGLNLIPLLDIQRNTVMAELRALNKSSRDLAETRNTQRLLVEKRIFELEAQARWLDRIEALEQ
ncbi:PadR family transcriptional regulator [Corynebacterium glutamicum]|uniref:PadR family transcriptional regulator n=1 Tax=Corynebacterium glutamicum TaxID=1718 RepID=UPI00117CE2A9|nr:PadR family transcriptional regulator [Corynebacterium glutamicum]QDQ20398.1 PadR family transcriptional regulator [Corynebacterium glutamicum]QDQ23964.1 PadR family transcriptional regulator [Corynebacterium glutamicum]